MRYLIFAILVFEIYGHHRRDPAAIFNSKFSKNGNPTANKDNWTVHWYEDMKLDHFTYSDTRTFKLKWLWNHDHYRPGGCIFFYTGNEGDIEGFARATGMMWDLAPEFNASIIFAEHRFYGDTQPFGNKSYASIENMGYLTSEQALADYATLITELKKPKNKYNYTFSKETPVLAFGGSYGGMLAAWFRMKYPHLVTGAWAASAPLLYFSGSGVDPGSFDSTTTKVYENAACNRTYMAMGWEAIRNLSSNKEGQDFLNGHFKIDPKSHITDQKGADNLIAYFREAVEYMAMVNYPYPTEFLKPLPAWPVQKSCEYMKTREGAVTDKELATMLYSVSNIYYNSSGLSKTNCIDPSKCGDEGTAGLGKDVYGWPWQECSEIVINMCAKGGKNDFFWNECKDNPISLLAETCLATFKDWTTAVWNIDAISVLYGLTTSGTSNLILTQGELDPWSGGGFQTNSPGVDEGRGIYVIKIPGAAHHLDLRTPNTCDPNTVSNTRYQIVQILKCWLNDCLTKLTPLPTMEVPTTSCKDVNHGYPWNQKKSAYLLLQYIPYLILFLFYNT